MLSTQALPDRWRTVFVRRVAHLLNENFELRPGVAPLVRIIVGRVASADLRPTAIRFAFNCTDPQVRRAVIGLVQASDKVAKADPPFEQWVGTQTFINPETRNKVKFHSLPAQEQARIRQRWDQQKQEAAGAEAQGKPEEEAEETKKEKPLQDRKDRAFDEWLGDQSSSTIEAYRSQRPRDVALVREKFEEHQQRPALVTQQQDKEREDKEFKQWLEDQGPEAQEAWQGEDRTKRVDIRQKFREHRTKKQEESSKETEKQVQRQREESRIPREKFFETPKDKRPRGWTESSDGNKFTENAEVAGGASVKKSRVSGRVHDDATVDNSEVHGTVEGSAKVKDSKVEHGAIVSDAAVISGSEVGFGSRIRGDTSIHDAVIVGGSWDGQKIKDGRGGKFHQAWDQETLDILTRITKSGSGSSAPGVGDGPLMSMVQYLEDGGRRRGLLGGKIDPKKLRERIQQHIYQNHDRKDPWLGRGASHLTEVSDEDLEKLMEVAQKEADRRKAESARRKKAMLSHLIHEAWSQPELRHELMPLIRLTQDSRVASGEVDFRSAALRYAFSNHDRRVRKIVVAAVCACDALPPLGMSAPHEERHALGDCEKLDLTPEQYRALIRLAYDTSNPTRRHRILGMLRQAKYGSAFLKWTEKRTFKHPATGNKVKFVSLPPDERTKIHDSWLESRKKWEAQFKPPGLTDTTRLTVESFDQLKPGDMLWVSWSPAMLHRVTSHVQSKSGKPVLEMALVDPKTGQDVETRFLYRSSLEKEDYEIHKVPPKAEEKVEEAVEKEQAKEEKKPAKPLPGPAATWKEMKESGMLEALVPGAKATHEAGTFDRGAKIKVESSSSGASGDFTVLGKFVIKGQDGTGYVLAHSDHGPTVIPISGPKAKGVTISLLGEGAQAPEELEAPKPEPSKIEEAAKPETPGKHKDRKELTGKPRKHGDEATKLMLPKSVVGLGAPEGMDPEVREKTIERMQALSLGEAKKLILHLSHAVKDMASTYAKGLLESGYTVEGIQKLHEALRARVRPYEAPHYAKAVLEIANLHDLEPEDADAVYDFRAKKPPVGLHLTDAQLMQRFLAKAKPETRDRMQGMSLADFMVMYKSIMADAEEDEVAAEAA